MAVSLVTVEHGSETRVDARTNLYLGATISFAAHFAPVRIRDLSRTGAKLDGAMLPGAETEAELRRGKLVAKAEVVWSNGARCGLRFLNPIDLHSWLPGTDLGRTQADVDRAIAQVRAGAAKDPARPALADATVSLKARLAEEIQCVARTLETVQDSLTVEPLLVVRHGTELQQIDISTQLLAQIAALLAAPNLQRAVETIATEGLRRRLTRSSL